MRNFEDLKTELRQATTSADIIRITEAADQDFLADQQRLQMQPHEWAEWSEMICAQWKKFNP